MEFRNVDRKRLTTLAARAVPVVVLVVAAVCYVLAANRVRFPEVFAHDDLWNPLAYVANAVFHLDWSHFAGNVRVWIPLGAVLTWLTSERHFVVVVVTAQFLTSVVSLAIGQFPVGLSGAVLAVAAAGLVRASGMAVQNSSNETVQTVVAGVFVPLAVAFLFIAIAVGGGSWIAHFGHFFGFLFGGSIEAMYVFSEYGSDEAAERPRRPRW